MTIEEAPDGAGWQAWNNLLDWLETKGFDRKSLKVELQESSQAGGKLNTFRMQCSGMLMTILHRRKTLGCKGEHSRARHYRISTVAVLTVLI